MRILVTRPAEDAPKFIAALEAKGHSAVWMPALVLRNSPGPDIELNRYQAVVITSANAIRALAQRTTDRQALLICVGDASAATARELGFQRVQRSGGEGVAGLVGILTTALQPTKGPILYPSAQDVAGNLQKDAAALGFTVDRQIVYAMEPAAAIPDEARAALTSGTLDAATYFSARSVTAALRAATAAGLHAGLARLPALCLSRAVAALAEPAHREVHVAAAATEGAMLQAIDCLKQHAE